MSTAGKGGAGRRRAATLALVIAMALVNLLALGASPARADWFEAHIARKGGSTWLPNRIDPDFIAGGSFHVLESDLTFTAHALRVSGHRKILSYSNHYHFPSFEWQFDLERSWGVDYAPYFSCDLPDCSVDTGEFDGPGSFAAISGTPQDITAGTYHVDIGVTKGSASSSRVELFVVAGAYSSSCPYWPSVPGCSFENYRVYYDKKRQHPAPGSYPEYRGGSYAWQRDSADPLCGGSTNYWRESYGNLKIDCTGLGPERPGTVWSVPPSGVNSTRIYKDPPTSFSGIATDDFTVEAVLRCDNGVSSSEDSSCMIRLGFQFKVDGAIVQNSYGRIQYVPNDGRWYLCRYDKRHGSAPSAQTSFNQMIPVVHIRDDTDPHWNELYIDNLIMFGFTSYGDAATTSTDSRTCNSL